MGISELSEKSMFILETFCSGVLVLYLLWSAHVASSQYFILVLYVCVFDLLVGFFCGGGGGSGQDLLKGLGVCGPSLVTQRWFAGCSGAILQWW